MLQRLDGLILAGGGDIDPVVYGASTHPAISRVDRLRDSFEMTLAQKSIDSTVPVLGICRGFQILNVVTGGNLVAHIPDEYGNKILHKAENGKSVKHTVHIEPHSRMAKITGSLKLNVESMHHQAASEIGSGWQIVAKSEDGIIEAIAKNKG
jgi:putative glutamine amidotransferase